MNLDGLTGHREKERQNEADNPGRYSQKWVHTTILGITMCTQHIRTNLHHNLNTKYIVSCKESVSCIHLVNKKASFFPCIKIFSDLWTLSLQEGAWQVCLQLVLVIVYCWASVNPELFKIDMLKWSNTSKPTSLFCLWAAPQIRIYQL